MKVYLTQDSEADVYTGHGSLQQVCPFMVLESFTPPLDLCCYNPIPSGKWVAFKTQPYA
jgi:hypothetical protein